jgi:hypothetical protein
MSDQPISEFERLGTTESASGFFGEFWIYLCQNKKWWLLPILVMLLLLGLLIVASGTGAAPFIYTLF